MSRWALLLVAVLLVACGGPTDRTPAVADRRPTWFGYDRAAEFQAVTERVSVPAGGTALACDLTRPARDGRPATGRFPALMYDFTPYHRPTDLPETDPTEQYLAERGYAVLQCDVPGTGGSPGPRYDLRNDVETVAGHDAVEWLATRDWSTGRVGMTGTSYGGWTALRVGATQPVGLAGVLTHVAPSSMYSQLVYPGGAPADADLVWADGISAPEQPAWAAVQREVWRAHPLYDGYWQGLDLADAWASVEVPTLGFGGWYDIFRAGAVDNHRGLVRASAAADDFLVMGPWTHGPADGADVQPVPLGAQLAWWDHWLDGGPDDTSGALPSAPVTSFAAPTDTQREWRTHEVVPDTAPTRLALTSSATLRPAPGEAGRLGYDVDPAAGPATTCLIGCATPEAPESDLGAMATGRVLFTGDPLGTDTHLFGAAVAELHLLLDPAADGPVVVKILDIGPDGSSREVAAGWMNVDHTPDHAALRPSPDDPRRTLTVPLQPTDWVVPAGHRLGVTVSSGDSPRLAPTASPGRVEVFTGVGGSTVSLPWGG